MARAAVYDDLAAALVALEAALRAAGDWQVHRPSAAQLASAQPFCVDTLTFVQWLQFVFIERLQVIVNKQKHLPSSSAVAAMAELYFAGQGGPHHPVSQLLAEIDNLITLHQRCD